jgi:hypothetical protein
MLKLYFSQLILLRINFKPEQEDSFKKIYINFGNNPCILLNPNWGVGPEINLQKCNTI